MGLATLNAPNHSIEESMFEIENNNLNSKIGLHYFPDTFHYRQEDISKWIPELRAMKVGWLVIKSSAERAIPESFIKALIDENITPVVEFNLALNGKTKVKELQVIFEAYARWGIKYIILFDRPNQKTQWQAVNWMQNDLVDRFLDQFIPLARQAIESGLVSVFPALEPGGSYWDTAFLRACFNHLQRRKQDLIINNMVLSAYAHSNGKSLNWGSGGPEQWPETRPYITPEGSQDQCGFRIFDWYQAIAQAVFQKEFPIILLQAASVQSPENTVLTEEQTKQNRLTQCQLIDILKEPQLNLSDSNGEVESIDTNVLSCNFWLLADSLADDTSGFAWFQNGEAVSPCVNRLKEEKKTFEEPVVSKSQIQYTPSTHHPIRHYVLLPLFESGVSDWHLAVVQPYIKKHQATLGFSLNEARLAANVTVVANPKTIPEECLNELRQAGCKVERIYGDGTSIATKLAER